MASTADTVLIWWTENPGIAVLGSMILICVAWRFAFMARVKFTVRRESKAIPRERELEHNLRAAQLRAVATRMADDGKEVA